MKRIILLAGAIIGLAGLASAQSTGSNSSKASQEGSETASKKQAKKKASNNKSKNLNDRKIYHWKDGQRATPTGHEATGTGSGYSAIQKDSSATPKEPARKNEGE